MPLTVKVFDNADCWGVSDGSLCVFLKYPIVPYRETDCVHIRPSCAPWQRHEADPTHCPLPNTGPRILLFEYHRVNFLMRMFRISYSISILTVLLIICI